MATFNIELFPTERSAAERVARRLAETEADIIAVQEIRDHAAFEKVVSKAGGMADRDYRLVLSNCGGDGLDITTGVIFDAARWSLLAMREYPGLDPRGRGSCWSGEHTGTLVVVEREDGMRVAALSVHLVPHAARFPVRKVQWDKVMRILAQVEREFEAHPVAMGDYNSTGFRGIPREERGYVEDVVERAGFDLTTRAIACTEYWRPTSNTFEPSVLDHIVVRGGQWSAPEALGMCDDLGCRRVEGEDMHRDFTTVSDHCPVRIRGWW